MLNRRGEVYHCKRRHNNYGAKLSGEPFCWTCKSEYARKYYLKNRDKTMRRTAKVGIDINFGGHREEVIQRDGERCVKCVMSRDEHKRRWNMDITVDHIDRRGKGKRKAEKNNDPSNLQTLCKACHSRKDTVFAWKRYKYVSDATIAEIREKYTKVGGRTNRRELAKEYGLNKEYISAIARGKVRTEPLDHKYSFEGKQLNPSNDKLFGKE